MFDGFRDPIMGGKGSGGKNRKPTAVKIAEGNRGKRKLNKKEPAAIPGEPPIPRELSPAARAVWPQIVAVLAEHGVLYTSNSIAIAALCSSYVHFFKADAQVEKYGQLTVKMERDLNGDPIGIAELKMNPAVRVRSDALKHLRACWQVFGLDPSSAAGVNANVPSDPAKSQSALDRILRSKSQRDDVVN